MERATQVELAKLFGRSQSWICKQQTLSTDPMPRDLAGASDWGQHRGFLAPAAPLMPAALPAIAQADLDLKKAKIERLGIDIAFEQGRLVPLDEVEQREVQMCSEFRRIACEYPRAARLVIERHVIDPVTVEKIVADLLPMAGDLLNSKAASAFLRLGKTLMEIRMMLNARTEEIMLELHAEVENGKPKVFAATETRSPGASSPGSIAGASSR